MPNKSKNKLIDDSETEEELKEDIAALRNELEYLRKKEKERLELEKVEKTQKDVSSNEPSLSQDQLKYNVFKFAGIICKSVSDNRSEFLFPTKNTDGSVTTYYIEIVNNQDQFLIKKHILPPGMKLSDLEEVDEITELLIKCQHQIICFQDRKRQYEKLKEKLKGIRNCDVLKDAGYSRIVIRFVLVHDVKANKCYNFDVYLFYKYYERLPSKISISPTIVGDNNAYDKKIEAKLTNLFAMPFKNLELSDGFDKMVSKNKEPYVWEPKDDVVNPVSSRIVYSEISEEDDMEAELSLSTRKKLRKTRLKKRLRESIDSAQNENEETPSDVGPKKTKRAKKVKKNKKETDLVSEIFESVLSGKSKSLKSTPERKQPNKRRGGKTDSKQKKLNFSAASNSSKNNTNNTVVNQTFKAPPIPKKKLAKEDAENTLDEMKKKNSANSSLVSSTPFAKRRDKNKYLQNISSISPIMEKTM